jgi:SanA protein
MRLNDQAPGSMIHKLLRILRFVGWYVAAMAIAAAIALLGCDWLVSASTQGLVHDRLADVAPAPVALLLGTNRMYAGRPNPYYAARIKAATGLFAAGKVAGIIVSGDNRRADYNEPAMMKADLMRAGVPGEFITMDRAGLRTLDSVVRVQTVFQQKKVIIVSQRFHTQRAIFLAQHFGLQAEGFVAEEPGWNWWIRVRTREVFARVMACLDVWVLDRKPGSLGPVETVRLRPDSLTRDEAATKSSAGL